LDYFARGVFFEVIECLVYEWPTTDVRREMRETGIAGCVFVEEVGD
jgi:hypothetical protein